MSQTTGQGSSFAIRWAQSGVVAGFLTCLIYPALIFMPSANLLAVVLAVFFGPSLAVASFGLRTVLSVRGRTIAADAAAILNTISGALFTTMVLIQLAEPMYTGVERAQPDIMSVWLAVDVAWDVYIGLGTILFSLAMFRHPRFGWPFSVSGIIIALLLLSLNLYTFPKPPANSGFFDAGPLVGLWYLAVSIQMLRSIPWVKRGSAAASNELETSNSHSRYVR